jgi:hypothetical protein
MGVALVSLLSPIIMPATVPLIPPRACPCSQFRWISGQRAWPATSTARPR